MEKILIININIITININIVYSISLKLFFGIIELLLWK